ncbi:Zn2/Cys6 DNA-binding protein [Glarea lozoyensis ATCC 20868]|uniref:Zn2/Cys6 DNA-binding protein n=1 Tax=Glarea lozoyensis (strain ATCC 20868 / MF5171) TaxID=1116229 RepID=S3DBH2_GLAL2|nr:Zn2/Cys6 DNA-binding protein [Glarea lozoyensis ATCC 20868]EPE35777.1 Zn2/Cys6 DNA-binding protein [Glarea lozoyensis ATCC 20868]
MAQSHETTARKRQIRAPMACQFCRHRKMRCTNEKPRCQNCVEHEKDCVYAELEKKPRPSGVRIAQLELENRRLQEKVSSLSAILQGTENARCGEPSSRDPNPQDDNSLSFAGLQSSTPRLGAQQMPTPGSASDSERHTVVQNTFSPDTESCYHGPTSTLFDESSVEVNDTQKVTDPKVPDLWKKRQLVAESANQRQLETVNFVAQKLVFDGVDPDLGMHLLSIFWNRQPVLGPIVYRTAFMRDMACAGPYFSTLLLNAIYFYSSKYSSRIEACQQPSNKLTIGWEYRKRAIALLNKSYDKSNITTVQALLIISSALFSWCDERSLSWLYAGMAFNMITDLGIHVDATTQKKRVSDEDSEICTRIFWAAYVIDKLQSLYQGRPSSLHKFNTNLSIDFTDEHEELELFNTLTYSETASNLMYPVYSISIFRETCKLCMILDKVILSLYSEDSSSKRPEELLRESTARTVELDNWKNTLPTQLNLDLSNSCTRTYLPHALSLISLFNVLIILIHRPYVSDGHLQSMSSSVVLDSFSKCAIAAFEIDNILKKYEQYYCLKTAPYIMSYATYVSATIHVRLAAQRNGPSDAHEALRNCVKVLNLQQSVGWAPKRAKRVIDVLITRLGVVLYDEDAFRTIAEVAVSDFDIDTITRMFSTAQPQADGLESAFANNTHQYSTGLAAGSSSTVQHSNILANEPEQVAEDRMAFTGEDIPFMYDPIFGFNGVTFDDWDNWGLGMGSDYT